MRVNVVIRPLPLKPRAAPLRPRLPRRTPLLSHPRLGLGPLLSRIGASSPPVHGISAEATARVRGGGGVCGGGGRGRGRERVLRPGVQLRGLAHGHRQLPALRARGLPGPRAAPPLWTYLLRPPLRPILRRTEPARLLR
jgi:hypothetical protein